MSLREVSWTDADGRHWLTLLPESAPDSQAPVGIPLGPPSLEALGLPLALEVRLHNELAARRLLRPQDLRGRSAEITSAIMAAMRVDAQTIEALYTV